MRPVLNPRMAECFGFAQFINHSTSPNCKITHVGSIQAIRKIDKGEELTVNYNNGDEEYYDFDNEGKRAEGVARLRSIIPPTHLRGLWTEKSPETKRKYGALPSKFKPSNWSMKKKDGISEPVAYPYPPNITSEDATGASMGAASAAASASSKSSE